MSTIALLLSIWLLTGVLGGGYDYKVVTPQPTTASPTTASPTEPVDDKEKCECFNIEKTLQEARYGYDNEICYTYVITNVCGDYYDFYKQDIDYIAIDTDKDLDECCEDYYGYGYTSDQCQIVTSSECKGINTEYSNKVDGIKCKIDDNSRSSYRRRMEGISGRRRRRLLGKRKSGSDDRNDDGRSGGYSYSDTTSVTICYDKEYVDGTNQENGKIEIGLGDCRDSYVFTCNVTGIIPKFCKETEEPTVVPSRSPTTAPSPTLCQELAENPDSRKEFDAVILVDTDGDYEASGGNVQCNRQQNFVADALTIIKSEEIVPNGQVPKSRVGVVEFDRDQVREIKSLFDSEVNGLSNDVLPSEMYDYLTLIEGRCDDGDFTNPFQSCDPNDPTQLYEALAFVRNNYFENPADPAPQNIQRDRFIIIFNNCRVPDDEVQRICEEFEDYIRVGNTAPRRGDNQAGDGINVVIINGGDESFSSGGDDYILCLTEYDEERIGVNPNRNKEGFAAILEETVVEEICKEDPTPAPTSDPTIDPTTDPTTIPSYVPTSDPTEDPTRSPTEDPTRSPTSDPTKSPTEDPTRSPTEDPTRSPTEDPTRSPTEDPTRSPTEDPTRSPTEDPTRSPTEDPTRSPTEDPTRSPTEDPTRSPTEDPTRSPTEDPTRSPTEDPTRSPTEDPTRSPTEDPTKSPTEDPTRSPTEDPTRSPTEDPTRSPTEDPTKSPTEDPTNSPTEDPTKSPTEDPTKSPTEDPTKSPTEDPTKSPTEDPTRSPTEDPTKSPTEDPTRSPTEDPTRSPTEDPTTNPTPRPTTYPTVAICVELVPDDRPKFDAVILVDTDGQYLNDVAMVPRFNQCEKQQNAVSDVLFIIKGEETTESGEAPKSRVGLIEFDKNDVTEIVSLYDPDVNGVDDDVSALEMLDYQLEIEERCYAIVGGSIADDTATLNAKTGAANRACDDSSPTKLFDALKYVRDDVFIFGADPLGDPQRDRFIIIFNNCRVPDDEVERICDEFEDYIKTGGADNQAGDGINVVIINQGKDGPFSDTDGDDYILCLTEYDQERIGSRLTRDIGSFPDISDPTVRDVVCGDPTPSPTSDPTSDPTEDPTRSPTEDPTRSPTEDPTKSPTEDPTKSPTEDPTKSPTEDPTKSPTEDPTKSPTEDPTKSPTEDPTRSPTEDPTKSPTEDPTKSPTEDPTKSPTEDPTRSPTEDPTKSPTEDPTKSPTEDPTKSPTEDPTKSPTEDPTKSPTEDPTKSPTEDPTRSPTEDPTRSPTEDPTRSPTEDPTKSPTEDPTRSPTEDPTRSPTEDPTRSPTEDPTRSPTEDPTKSPTEDPTRSPTEDPTRSPTEDPTKSPTKSPTEDPTGSPTEDPTRSPTDMPTKWPTEDPTQSPTEDPTRAPSDQPTRAPTDDPTKSPTEDPTRSPTEDPTRSPTEDPTRSPTEDPTQSPTADPTTSSPTEKPTPDDCDIDYEIDIVFVVDISCEITKKECEDQQEMIADIFSVIRGPDLGPDINGGQQETMKVRVAYMEMGSNSVDELVDFNSNPADDPNTINTGKVSYNSGSVLLTDPDSEFYNGVGIKPDTLLLINDRYYKFIKGRSDDICTEAALQGRSGSPNLYEALFKIMIGDGSLFDEADSDNLQRDREVLIFSNCKVTQDEREEICERFEDEIRNPSNSPAGQDNGINVQMINTPPDDSTVTDALTDEDCDEYLSCLTEYDPDKRIFCNEQNCTNTTIGGDYNLQFVVDESGSIDEQDYIDTLEFIKGLIDTIINPFPTRLSFYSFDSDVVKQHSFNDAQNDGRQAIKDAITAEQSNFDAGSATATGVALDTSIQDFIDYTSEFDDNILILFTDGLSNSGFTPCDDDNSLQDEALALKIDDNNIRIIIIEIGNFVDDSISCLTDDIFTVPELGEEEFANLEKDLEETIFSCPPYDPDVLKFVEQTICECEPTPTPTMDPTSDPTQDPVANIYTRKYDPYYAQSDKNSGVDTGGFTSLQSSPENHPKAVLRNLYNTSTATDTHLILSVFTSILLVIGVCLCAYNCCYNKNNKIKEDGYIKNKKLQEEEIEDDSDDSDSSDATDEEQLVE